MYAIYKKNILLKVKEILVTTSNRYVMKFEGLVGARDVKRNCKKGNFVLLSHKPIRW
jgi:hypothetical protein